MKIKMLDTRRGTQDGFKIEKFEKGQEYDVAHGLACQFIKRGQAVQVNAPTVEEGVAKLMAMLEQQRANRLNADQL